MAYNNYMFPQGYYPAIIPQYQQTVPQIQQNVPQQQAQPQNNGIIWVQGEQAAKGYPVAPNQSVLLMDSEQSAFYIKSADNAGMPQPLRIFELPDTYSKCQKLATFYILLNSLYPEEDFKNDINTQFQSTIPNLGESEFLKKIKGRELNYVLSVLDELMEALKALNPQLYANTLRRFE